MSRVHAARRAIFGGVESIAGTVYGTIVVMAVIAGGSRGAETDPWRLAVLAAATSVVIWVAHVYAHALSKSIADGLMNLRPGDITFAHIRKFVDEVVTVGEENIAGTVGWLFRNARLVVEPSGAVTTAAVALGLGHVDLTKGPVVAVVSGGNVAPEAFAKYVSVAY